MKKIVFLFVIFSMGLLACSRDEAEDVPATVLVSDRMPVDVVLTVWHPFTGPLADALEVVTGLFNTRDDQVTVNLSYHVPEGYRSDYEQAVQLGGGPDLLIVEHAWLASLADSHLIHPMDQVLAEYVSENVPMTVYQSLEYEGSIWGAPLTVDLPVLYSTLNSSLDNLDVLLNVAQFDRVALYPGTEGMMGLYLDNRSGVVDERGQPQFQRVALIEFFARYRELALSQGITFSRDLNDLVVGEVALQMGYISDYPDLLSEMDDEIYVRALPPIGQTLWRPLVRVIPLVISRNATGTMIQGAERYIEFLLSSEAQMRLAEVAGRPPLVLEMDAMLDTELRMLWTQLQSTQTWSPYPVFNDVIMPLLDEFLVTALEADQDEVRLADSFLASLP